MIHYLTLLLHSNHCHTDMADDSLDVNKINLILAGEQYVIDCGEEIT